MSPQKSAQSIQHIFIKTGLILALIAIIAFLLLFCSIKYRMETLQKEEITTTVGLITQAIESSKQSALSYERLIDQRLHTISLALAAELQGRQAATITREELTRLKNKWDLYDISIFVQKEEDIVVLESSDPNEVGLSSKNWGYWYTVFQQLFALQPVDVEAGYAAAHYFVGPYSRSEVYDKPFKYAYYYDGTTDFIMNPYIENAELDHFVSTSGPSSLIDNIIHNSSHITEISVINIKPYLNQEHHRIVEPHRDLPVLYGEHHTVLPADEEIITRALTTNINESQRYVWEGQLFEKIYVSLDDDRLLMITMDVNDTRVMVRQFFLFMLAIFITAAGILMFYYYKVSRKARRLLNHMDWLAYYDPLTQLANRNHFIEYVSQLIKEHNDKIHAILIIDLDHFKGINDTLGHAIGDRFLAQVAARIQHNIRPRGIVARMGGDEFIIVIPETSRSDTEEIASELIHCMSEPFEVDSHRLNMSISIGVSMYPQDGTQAGTLLKHAATALYWDTGNDKTNITYFREEMNMEVKRRLEIEKHMRTSLGAGHFMLHYQPQIDLDTGRVIGLEALVRWNHPTRGLIGPGEFIPIAEKTGLIIPLGEWIMHEAFQQYEQLVAQGMPPIRLSVNLSARQFHQRDLLEKIRMMIRTTGLDPQRLTLEITENTSMNDMNYTIEVLTQLRQEGVKIAIDDFGIAYSALGYLNRLPIDYLKIDRSFVDRMDVDQHAATIVRSIVDIAENLQLKVIAEGVETSQQVAYLQQNRCHEAQGYYFGRPMPYEQVYGVVATSWKSHANIS